MIDRFFFRMALAIGLASFSVPAVSAQTQLASPALASGFPQWAFPGAKKLSLDPTSKQFSWVQIYDRTRAVDWHPEDHPKMPDAVMGRQPVFACGFCHLPEGAGRPENAALAGLPEDYLERQITELRSGARRSADPDFGPISNMLASMKLIPDAEFAKDAKEVAQYYSSLTYTKHLKLTETNEVPAHAGDGFVNEFDFKAPKVPLGYTIVEGPSDFERFEMRDAKLLMLAYVPVGSVERGAVLVKGDADRPACETCHGTGLKGGPLAPPIAGRLPTGLFRQLYSFQIGTRNGEQAVLMKPIVEKLTQNQMVDLAAYVASLNP